MCSCHKLLLYININNNPRSFHTVQALYDLPDYFEENGYKSPDDGYDGSFQYARATNLTVFEYLATKPKLQQAFKNTMKITSQRQELQWFEYFPADTNICVESSSDPLLVDIGGFLGPDLTAFKQSHPAISGKLSSTLQDLPAVIDNVKDLSPASRPWRMISSRCSLSRA